MAEENLFVVDRGKALRALAKAKEVNAGKTVPIQVDRNTVVYIRPDQANDEKFMELFWKKYKR